MSYILCRWLNTKLRLSRVVEPKTFARDFSNGYLIGEILHKYNLQTDFDTFSKDDNKSSKANNFSRLRTTLQMIEISLDETTVQELMEGNQGAASHLIYMLYVALEQKNKIIGGSLESLMPKASSAYRCKKEQDLYSERLHRGFDSADTNPGQISQPIQDEDQQLNLKLMEADAAQHKKPLPVKDNTKGRMNVTTIVQKAKALQKKKEEQRRREKQAQVQNEIQKFEENTKLTISAISEFSLEEPKSEADYAKDIESKQHLNSEYIEQIRQRLKENVFTQKQRERRAAQFLVEQSKARKTEQDEQIEESLVKRLTRQTIKEKHLVSELLHIRLQKEVMIKNNLMRQQQFHQRREKDFQEALDREALLARQEKLTPAAEIQRKLDMCNKLAAERKQKRYMKHFNICKVVMGQIVDLATKAGDYRLHTASIIPEKQMKEWKEFLLSGLPLYETVQDEKEENNQLDSVEFLKQDVLDKLDYEEYEKMIGEWAQPEEAQQTKIPSTKSSIFDHVIVQMRNIVHPTPAFPPFILKACVLGKSCSGKTTCLDKIAQAHGFYILSINKLVEEVLNAYHSKDVISDQQSNSHTKDDQESTDTKSFQLTKWALLGEAADKVMTEGKPLSNELLVDIITEAIRHLPAYSGWILDGFPVNISQAHLIEKALGGSDEKVGKVSDSLNDPAKISAPVLDLALILDVSDDCVTSRTAKQTDENKLAEISSRVAAFEDTWPQLEEWFGTKQNILVHVNADVDEEELFKAVESILQPVNQPTGGPESSFNHDQPLSIVDEQLPADLLEELWSISDTRREENEQKIAHVKEDGWLVDCTDVLLQHHSTLIQVEVERFQAILSILQTYYLSMCEQIMPGNSLGVQEECMQSKIRPDEKAAKVLAESPLFDREAREPKDKEEINPCPSTDRNRDATKVRIALIKIHGLKMVDCLQSRLDKMKNTMEELVKEQFMVEIKSVQRRAAVRDRASGLVPLFKKGDSKVCSNSRGIIPLSLPDKVYARDWRGESGQ
ncbi:sperm flagellar protein 2-like [Boleophthalmus pectinirostris]|uniref:sperm flagellar protein 2-like n=1 Tax=Boleophthalmus pectinirostris TaxID=150288 RepID=UPI00242FC55C|nr:sperm flagellar protein 2-like [Boleophthalmus pectinirostris]